MDQLERLAAQYLAVLGNGDLLCFPAKQLSQSSPACLISSQQRVETEQQPAGGRNIAAWNKQGKLRSSREERIGRGSEETYRKASRSRQREVQGTDEPPQSRSSRVGIGEVRRMREREEKKRKPDDEENEEEGGLSKSGKELKKLLGRAAGLNESDADEDEDDDDQEDESSPVLAPKQKDQVKDEPVDNSPAKPAPLGHARGTPPASKSKQKRKLGVDDAKTSSGAASKKAKDTKASGLKEEASSSAKPASKISASSKSGTNISPVTEDEIRSVLLAVAPVTTQDLVSRFKSRLRGSEDKNAFAEILKKISKIQKTNGHNYVVLRDDKK
uniref:Transcription initiation factor IIF subunit alpha n=1 Tax=Sorghum bicolor TaxID=4558 RepID=C6JRY1_SORBI